MGLGSCIYRKGTTPEIATLMSPDTLDLFMAIEVKLLKLPSALESCTEKTFFGSKAPSTEYETVKESPGQIVMSGRGFIVTVWASADPARRSTSSNSRGRVIKERFDDKG